MGTSRRRFLGALGAGIALGPQGTYGAPPDRPIYLSAAKAGDAHRVVLLDETGKIRWSLALPGRGHGGAFRPHSNDCIIFARRPGQFALVLDHNKGLLIQTLVPPRGRHFYGHGCYSNDGRRLYTTENDFDGERGVIGLWDTVDNYRRIGEYDSHGIGPHELILMPDGHTLAIANGGIATHPETGRQKLNIPDMEPSLVLLDGRDGSLANKYVPPRELHKVSLRHLSANVEGALFAAAQFEGPSDDRPPLLASFHSGGMRFHAAPEDVQVSMRNYCGSVSFSKTGQFLAVSCPRGNLITYWTDDGVFVSSMALRDVCGIAPDGEPGAFLATSGDGMMILGPPHRATPISSERSINLLWDNHITSQMPVPD